MGEKGSPGPELAWRKAQSSANNGACVELASIDGMIAIRDSKNLEGPILRCGAVAWRAFLLGAKDGTYDHSS
ncbi:MAG TPA: DUF397 domain-containing protein [Streptosporangiaceae bacterium]